MASIVEIVAKFINEASPGLEKLGQDVKDVDDKGKGTTSSLAGMGSSLAELAGGLGLTLSAAGAVTAAFGLLKSSVDAYGEAEVVAAQVNAVIQSTGGAAGVTADEVDRLATELSQMSGVDDEVIARGEALLLTFTKISDDMFPAATEAALNMSMAMGTDLQSSIIQVGKALNDPVEGATALRRVGVSLTEQQQEQIKSFMEINDLASAQALILNELAVEFGGVAEMMGNTTVGATNKLNVAWGDLLEVMGEDSAGAWSQIAGGLTTIIKDMTRAYEVADQYNDIQKSLGTGHQITASYIDTNSAAVRGLLGDFERAGAMGDYWTERLEAVASSTERAAASTQSFELTLAAVQAGIQGPLANAQERYDERMSSLVGKHQDLSSELEKLTSWGYPATSEKVVELTEKIAENEAAQLKEAAALDEVTTRLIFQQASAGLDAVAQLELARAMGILDEESYAAATATQRLKDQYEAGKLTASEYADKVAGLRDTIDSLKDKNVAITLDIIQNYATGPSNRSIDKDTPQAYAEGTGGWKTVPSGFPNDSYPIWLTSGESFAVVPGSTPAPASMAVGGAAPVAVNIIINTPINLMDQETAQGVLAPMVVEAVKQAQSEGVLSQ